MHPHRFRTLVLLALLSLVLPSLRLEGTPSARVDHKGAERVTAAQLKDYLYFIASDEMEGRNTPSRGLDLTAKFMATLLSRWGVKPGGVDGSYFQPIMLRTDRVEEEKCSLTVGDKPFEHGRDYLVPTTAGPGGSAAGGMVYVGNGWLVKSKQIDSIGSLDVKGKVLLVSGLGRQPPPGVRTADLPPDKKGSDWADPLTHAALRGAVGVVFIVSEEAPLRTSLGRFVQPSFLAPEGSRAAESSGQVPSVVVGAEVAREIFAGEKVEGEAVLERGSAVGAFTLSANKTIAFRTAVVADRQRTQNVIAVIEGTDPKLKSEYVALSAHYDHVGVSQTRTTGDRIYNGADDDGSGTVALLAIAEAFATGKVKPKRSVLFIWHCGEERGLWGSAHYVANPTVPLEKIISLVNIDMVGRVRAPGDTNPRNAELVPEGEIYVIGSTLMSTSLEKTLHAVNRGYLNLKLNTKFDDPRDPKRYFFRSDHLHYARKGIPALFFFNGEHEDYHGLGDHPEKIAYKQLETVTRTIFRLVLELANQRERPRVDKELPPELRG